MDIVYVRALEVHTIIGIYEWERENRQPVIIDLDMAWDIRAAAETDDINKTLDYKKVCDELTSFIEGSSFQLIETMAEQIAEKVMQEFGVKWIRVRVGKPDAISTTHDVGVVIERGQRFDGISS